MSDPYADVGQSDPYADVGDEEEEFVPEWSDYERRFLSGVIPGTDEMNAFTKSIFAKGLPFGDSSIDIFNPINRALGREWDTEDWQKASKADTWNDAYGMLLEGERGRDKQMREAYPGLSLALEVGGGVAGMMALYTKAPKLFEALFGGLTLPKQMFRGAVSGGAISGAHGFGEGEGSFGQRATGAIMPAMAGVAGGVASPVVGRFGKKTYDRIRDVLGKGPSISAEEAGSALQTAVTRDKLSPEALSTSESTLYDVGGRATQAAGRSVARTYPSRGGMTMDDAIQEGRMVGEGLEGELKTAADRAADVAAGIAPPPRPPPGVTQNLANITGLLGKGAGDWVADTAYAVGSKFASGNVDEITFQMARMLTERAPEALKDIAALAASRGRSEAQRKMIYDLVMAVGAGAVSGPQRGLTNETVDRKSMGQ